MPLHKGLPFCKTSYTTLFFIYFGLTPRYFLIQNLKPQRFHSPSLSLCRDVSTSAVGYNLRSRFEVKTVQPAETGRTEIF